MSKIRIKTVTLIEMSNGASHTFNNVSDANEAIALAPSTQFEFKVTWEDGTGQTARLTGKTINQWLSGWVERMLQGPPEASDAERKEFVRQVKEQNPKLVEHAERLLNRELEGIDAPVLGNTGTEFEDYLRRNNRDLTKS